MVLTGTALALLVLLPGCGRQQPEARPSAVRDLPAVAVHVRNVQSKQEAATEEVVGTVRAKLRATLEARVSGRIGQLPLVLGQRVAAGDLVARLEAPEIQARLEQAQAGLAQAERDWKRSSALLEQRAVTRAEADAADSRYRLAKAAVAEAQAMAGYLEVRAPFAGVVAKKWAEVGDLAAPGKALVVIEDESALQVEADVPEGIASKVRRDSRLGIRVDWLTNDLSGVVAELAPAAEPLSRTFRVRLDLAACPGLMPGQFARLVVPVGESRSLRVPASAVVQRGQLEIAFIAANQRAQLHLVKTGKRLGDEVEILSGLDAGDAVIVDGVAQLVDGQPVEVKSN